MVAVLVHDREPVLPLGEPSDWGDFGFYNIRCWKKQLIKTTDPVVLEISWLEIISHYSRGNLAHSGDKLVALSGLAKR